jgi:hypothetical protein
MRATPGKRLEMVDLQVASFAATLPPSVDETTAPRIAFVNFTPQRRWNVSAAPPPVRVTVSRIWRIAAPALEAPRIKLIDFDHLGVTIETRA